MSFKPEAVRHLEVGDHQQDAGERLGDEDEGHHRRFEAEVVAGKAVSGPGRHRDAPDGRRQRDDHRVGHVVGEVAPLEDLAVGVKRPDFRHEGDRTEWVSRFVFSDEMMIQYIGKSVRISSATAMATRSASERRLPRTLA